jgi:probable phosphoglycerate mutase
VTETKTTDLITAYCDGGSRGNPGPAGYGVSIEDAAGHPIADLSEFLGVKTNNFAEYSGLLAALEYALSHGHSRLRVIADSELMVKQMKGQYRVNSPDLRPLWEEAKRRAERLEKFEIQHVLRGKNKRADALANQAMDRGTGKTVRDIGGSAGASSTLSRVAASAERSARPTEKRTEGVDKPRVLKGFVKNGVVHLLEGELPENCFVRVMVE